MMNPSHYEFTRIMKSLWEKAVQQYETGNRDSATYFTDEETAWLGAVGHSPQEVYDFAEDWTSAGEPDVETFLLIALQRRNFYLMEMGGQCGDKVVDTGDLPPKEAAVRGIEWLPRIIPKARAKLRGEMSTDLMYSCGGDRKFFKANDIHPAEFLDLVRRHWNEDEAIVDWVVSRSRAVAKG